MGYKDITPGNKTAKAKGARFIKSKTGKLGIEVAFEFIEMPAGSVEHMTWVGWLSDAAIKYTMDTMVNVLGYNGSEEVDANGVLTDPNVLAFDRDVRLVVEDEPYVTDSGETRSSMKIKYVNSIGGSAFSGVAPQSVKSELAGVGFRAAFLSLKKSEPKSAPPEVVKDEKLPF